MNSSLCQILELLPTSKYWAALAIDPELSDPTGALIYHQDFGHLWEEYTKKYNSGGEDL